MNLSFDDLQKIGTVVEAAVANKMGILDRRMQQIEHEHEEHRMLLYGDNTNENPGVKEAVRDLTKRAKFWGTLGWVIVGAVAAPLVGGTVVGVVWAIRHIQ